MNPIAEDILMHYGVGKMEGAPGGAAEDTPWVVERTPTSTAVIFSAVWKPCGSPG